jgi:hypothetical protein
VVGGEDASGTLLTDVWFMRLDEVATPSWRPIATEGVSIGKVLAATYPFADDRLWVLDESEDIKKGRTARVVRIDPRRGHAEVLFSTPHTRFDVTPFFSVDNDGTPLLALARDKKFTLYRVTAKPCPQVVRHMDERRGRLVRAPIVDSNGYSFVLREDDGWLRLDRLNTDHKKVADVSNAHGNQCDAEHGIGAFADLF